MKKISSLLFILLPSSILLAQPETRDSSRTVVTLDEVVVSVNKSEEHTRQVAQQVQQIPQAEIEARPTMTTAELLSQTGNVPVQKSQLGGGSPVLRGFEASRILLEVDGVRLNNLIYRAG